MHESARLLLRTQCWMLQAHDPCYGRQFLKQSLLTHHISWRLQEHSLEHVSWTSTQPHHKKKHHKWEHHHKNNAKTSAKKDIIAPTSRSMATQGKTLKHCMCHGFVNKCTTSSRFKKLRLQLENVLAEKCKVCGIWHLSHKTSQQTQTLYIYRIPQHSVKSPQDQANTGPTAACRPPPQHHRFYRTPSLKAGLLRSCSGRPPLPAKITETTSIHSLFKEVRQSMSVNVGQCLAGPSP